MKRTLSRIAALLSLSLVSTPVVAQQETENVAAFARRAGAAAPQVAP